jgi:hypothetical protein
MRHITDACPAHLNHDDEQSMTGAATASGQNTTTIRSNVWVAYDATQKIVAYYTPSDGTQTLQPPQRQLPSRIAAPDEIDCMAEPCATTWKPHVHVDTADSEPVVNDRTPIRGSLAVTSVNLTQPCRGPGVPPTRRPEKGVHVRRVCDESLGVGLRPTPAGSGICSGFLYLGRDSSSVGPTGRRFCPADFCFDLVCRMLCVRTFELTSVGGRCVHVRPPQAPHLPLPRMKGCVYFRFGVCSCCRSVTVVILATYSPCLCVALILPCCHG